MIQSNAAMVPTNTAPAAKNLFRFAAEYALLRSGNLMLQAYTPMYVFRNLATVSSKRVGMPWSITVALRNVFGPAMETDSDIERHPLGRPRFYVVGERKNRFSVA